MKIKNILVSQPQPTDWEKSPYYNIHKSFNVNIDFFKFFRIEGITAKEFRKQKVCILDHTAVIFTSKLAVDHFFRLAKETRTEIPEVMKYFCSSEAITFYLQNYIPFRKRRIFHGKENVFDMIDIIKKHGNELFLVPCSDTKKQDIIILLKENNIKHTKATIYKNVSADLSKIDIKHYEMMILFSPAGVKSLLKNYPDFQQGEMLIGAFGPTTAQAIRDAGLILNLEAPTKTAPSMTMALDQFLKANNKKK